MKGISSLVAAGLLFLPLGILLNDYHETKLASVRMEEQEECRQLVSQLEQQYWIDIQEAEDENAALRKRIAALEMALAEERREREDDRRQAEEQLAQAYDWGEKQLALQAQQFEWARIQLDSIHRQFVTDTIANDRRMWNLVHAEQVQHLQRRIHELTEAVDRQKRLVNVRMGTARLELSDINWSRALKLIGCVFGIILITTVLAAASQRFLRRI